METLLLMYWIPEMIKSPAVMYPKASFNEYHCYVCTILCQCLFRVSQKCPILVLFFIGYYVSCFIKFVNSIVFTILFVSSIVFTILLFTRFKKDEKVQIFFAP